MSSEEEDEPRTDESDDDDDDPFADIGDEPVAPDDARVLIARDKADVIDIRGDEEAFADEHVPGSRRLDPADKEALSQELPEDRPVVLVCESGEESAELAATLREDGRTVVSIEGGMDSWKSAGLPVQPNTDEEFPGPEFKPPGA